MRVPDLPCQFTRSACACFSTLTGNVAGPAAKLKIRPSASDVAGALVGAGAVAVHRVVGGDRLAILLWTAVVDIVKV